MVYLSTLMAMEDDRVFRQALDEGGPDVGVEIFSFRFDREDMPGLRARIRAYAGHPITFHGPMRSAELTSPQDSQAWRASLDAYRRALELAQLSGAVHMVAHTHECHVTPGDKQEKMARCEENLHALSREAARYGVTLCVENVSLPCKGEPLFNEEEYIALIHRLDTCRALVDVGHIHCTGWSLEHVCSALGNQIAGFHLHNNDGHDDLHSWIHDGTMDMANTRKIISMYSNQADFVLEYAGMENRSAKDLLRDAVFMTEGLRR